VLALGLGITALVLDELLTKIGLKLGCVEHNRFFNFLKKERGERCAHTFLTLVGSLMLLCLFLIFDFGVLLMLFAVVLMVPVVVNALTILRVLDLKQSQNSHVEKP
jgi:uncharacterized membrane protein